MIHVQVIDKTSEIEQSLVSVDADIFYFNDEVQALNSLDQLSDVEDQPQPSVVLLNYTVRAEDTVEYIKLIRNANPDVNVVVIADELDEAETLNCLIAGAKGYQDINQLADYASRLINVIDDGEAWITRRMTATLLDRLRQ